MKSSLAASLLCLATLARADGVAAGSAADLPLWELGVAAGRASQPAYPGADERVGRNALLPFAIYRGRVLRADDEGAGLRAIRTDGFELDLSFGGSLSSGGKPVQAREGMARLRTLVEVGPLARWYLNGRDASERLTFELPLRGVFEARDPRRHRGFSLEPQLALEHRVAGRWSYGASLGLLLGDRRLASTYYAVAPGEALAWRPAYEARAGLIAWRLKAGIAQQLAPDLRLFAFGRIDSLAGAANRDSPLVRRTTGASLGLGLSYTLQRSSARAID